VFCPLLKRWRPVAEKPGVGKEPPQFLAAELFACLLFTPMLESVLCADWKIVTRTGDSSETESPSCCDTF